MIAHRKDSIIGERIRALREEIAADDYQIIKAVRMGVDVDTLYPLHRANYQKRMTKLAELEQEAAEIAEAEAHLAALDKG
jgi:hypothetical protein